MRCKLLSYVSVALLDPICHAFEAIISIGATIFTPMALIEGFSIYVFTVLLCPVCSDNQNNKSNTICMHYLLNPLTAGAEYIRVFTYLLSNSVPPFKHVKAIM